jgi:hypothetical protein
LGGRPVVTGVTLIAALRIAFWNAANEPDSLSLPHSTIHTLSGAPAATRSKGSAMPFFATLGPWSTNSATRHE